MARSLRVGFWGENGHDVGVCGVCMKRIVSTVKPWYGHATRANGVELGHPKTIPEQP